MYKESSCAYKEVISCQDKSITRTNRYLIYAERARECNGFRCRSKLHVTEAARSFVFDTCRGIDSEKRAIAGLYEGSTGCNANISCNVECGIPLCEGAGKNCECTVYIRSILKRPRCIGTGEGHCIKLMAVACNCLCSCGCEGNGAIARCSSSGRIPRTVESDCVTLEVECAVNIEIMCGNCSSRLKGGTCPHEQFLADRNGHST